MWLGKKQWNPPEREAFIEDDGESFQIMLIEDGVQVGGCFLPDDGAGEAFELAQGIASDWLSYNDRVQRSEKPKVRH